MQTVGGGGGKRGDCIHERNLPLTCVGADVEEILANPAEAWLAAVVGAQRSLFNQPQADENVGNVVEPADLGC